MRIALLLLRGDTIAAIGHLSGAEGVSGSTPAGGPLRQASSISTRTAGAGCSLSSQRRTTCAKAGR